MDSLLNFFRLGIGVSQTQNHTQNNGRDANRQGSNVSFTNAELVEFAADLAQRGIVQ